MPSLVEIHLMVLKKKSFKEELYMLPLFSPLWPPQGEITTFFYTNFDCHHQGILSTKFGQNWWKLNFCPFLAPPGGAVFGPNFFSFANFVGLSLRTLNIKYEDNLTIGSWEENFWRFSKFYPFLPPPGAPIGATPFLFANLKRLHMGILCIKFSWNPCSL